jgi:hypothetical protein
VAVSLRTVRWLRLWKIDFLQFLCVERHWYTSVQNEFIFWKLFFTASLDAETHFTRAELFSSKFEGWISVNFRVALSQNAWLFPSQQVKTQLTFSVAKNKRIWINREKTTGTWRHTGFCFLFGLQNYTKSEGLDLLKGT